MNQPLTAHTLELRDLAIGYVVGHAVRTVATGLCATLTSGTVTCLVGSNGVGKSTLLRTLTAFQPPLSGAVLLDGQPLHPYAKASGLPRHTLAETIGVVLTDHADLAGLTVWDVAAMGRSPYTNFWGHLTTADRTIVDASIAAVGLTPLATRRMDEVSDGERQKVLIAKALAQQTPVIVLDEPTAFLDYPSKIAVMELLTHLAHDLGKLILLTSHDLDIAYRHADALWLLRPDTLVTHPTPADLATLHFFPAQ